MTVAELQQELRHIQVIKIQDRDEAEERLAALQERIKEYIEKNKISGIWRQTLEKYLDL